VSVIIHLVKCIAQHRMLAASANLFITLWLQAVILWHHSQYVHWCTGNDVGFLKCESSRLWCRQFFCLYSRWKIFVHTNN